MKKATLIIWVIIIGFIALVIFQNQTFFMAKNTWRLNLGVFKEYLSPELPNAVLLLFFFFAGVVITYLFSFSARFKAKRTIKKLNTSITSHVGEITELKRENDKLKGIETQTETDIQTDTTKLEPNATPKITDESTVESLAEHSGKSGAAKEPPPPAEDTKDNSSEKKK